MKKCECGHVHCCHKHSAKRETRTLNKQGKRIRFFRKICTRCNAWLGDEDLQFV